MLMMCLYRISKVKTEAALDEFNPIMFNYFNAFTYFLFEVCAVLQLDISNISVNFESLVDDTVSNYTDAIYMGQNEVYTETWQTIIFLAV